MENSLNIPHNQPLSPEQYDEVVRRINDNIPMVSPEIHLESLEESLAHEAIKRLYLALGSEAPYKMSSIRITKRSTLRGPAMTATGSIRVHFVGHSTVNDIHPV